MPNGLYSKATHALRYFLLRRLPACKEMTELMSASLERRLTVRERVRLKLHLWVCAWCVWYLEQLRLMRNALSLRRETEFADDATPNASSTKDSTASVSSTKDSTPNVSSTNDATSPSAQLSAEARERIKLALNRTRQ